ncbi:MAG: hypothetical protein COB98_02330 [Flavobacteriaceae bacterium]|nr:MAG: hypothetical protein COB98_02330 [Flavobacteriaceae bacterium]
MLIESVYNYKHRLVDAHFLVKIVYVLPAFVLVLISENTAFHGFAFCLIFIACKYIAKVPIFHLLKLFSVPFLFIFIGCFTLLFSFDKIHGIGILDDSYFLGIAIFTKSMALISVMYFFLLTHTISEISKYMYACKVPSLFIELFVLTYKFIYLLSDTAKSMQIAQKCRMGDQQGYLNTVRNYGLLFSMVFRHAMLQTEQLEIAMSARLGSNNFVFVQEKHAYSFMNLLAPILFVLLLITALLLL